MLNKFNSFVQKNQLFASTDKILLAVSGGVDSMVLLDIFDKIGVNFSVVHCNFKLRGNESDQDELFVKEHVARIGVECYVKKFDTSEYAKLNGISIEMAARELRYNYFDELCENYNYNYIATAHHQDDLIETFFINLIRKTGIKGLTGIKPKAGNIIRPLLFANRNNILNYASQNSIAFREDSSNKSTEFKRNFIRHKIIPDFENINTAFRKNIIASINHLKEVEQVYAFAIKKDKDKVIREVDGVAKIDITGLLDASFPKVLLFELLNSYHFNAAVINKIFESLEEESGKQFFSQTHRVVKDRKELIITKIKEDSSLVYYIEKEDIELFNPLSLEIGIFRNQSYNIPRNPTIASLDIDKLNFPLILKKWKKGEYFQPLGMDGLKKISDFFIDEKLSIPEKENAWILYSGDKVAWVMGYRVDNRFKITSETKTIYRIDIL
jgi:tRNA(Ile)-lysidine synthase